MQCTPYGPCLALRITEQCCCSALHGVTQQVIRNTSAPGAKGPQTSPGNGRLAIKIITWGLPRGRGPALGCELLSDFGMRLWASCCTRRCWFPLLRHRGIQTPPACLHCGIQAAWRRCSGLLLPFCTRLATLMRKTGLITMRAPGCLCF